MSLDETRSGWQEVAMDEELEAQLIEEVSGRRTNIEAFEHPSKEDAHRAMASISTDSERSFSPECAVKRKPISFRMGYQLKENLPKNSRVSRRPRAHIIHDPTRKLEQPSTRVLSCQGEIRGVILECPDQGPPRTLSPALMLPGGSAASQSWANDPRFSDQRGTVAKIQSSLLVQRASDGLRSALDRSDSME